MQIREAIKYYQNTLSSLYDANESRSIAELVLMHIFNFSKTHLLTNDNSILNDEQKKLIENYLNRLVTGEPVQYVLGETEFYGLKFLVNKNVLIPRPETEELVDWMLIEIGNWKLEIGKPKLLDIGTGSGCIPISIKKNIPTLEVYALDISTDALTIAKKNATMNNVEVNLFEADILQSEISKLKNEKFNLIVSNPPYIRKSEMKLMHKNVIDFEPHQALFVEDDDALLFYKRIADFGLLHLSPKGKLYFEINEAKGNSIVEMLNQKGFQNVVMKKDMFGKERMIKCETK